jgi:4'-phosphopantetheinyl transferase
MTNDLGRTGDSARIDIWLCPYRQIAAPEHIAALRALLSPPEQDQAQRFHFADDSHRYLVTRALVRTVLSRYAPVAPQDWVFATNPYGRPAIANGHVAAQAVDFNVSHTAGLIAMAVSTRGALGIDLEDWQIRPASVDTARDFFAPAESADLADAPPAQVQERFFEYWTLKESYIKARGMGLSIPLDRFAIELAGSHGVRMTASTALADDPARWWFGLFRLRPAYLLALCVEHPSTGAAPALSFRTTLPLMADTDCPAELSRSSSFVRP